jgi:DNA-binding transcriptional regulator YdaS (Cro superfamily)
MEAAIKHFGSEVKLAAAIGVSQTAINKAKRRARVSAEMAVAIERASGGVVSRSEFRPDLWSENGAAA